MADHEASGWAVRDRTGLKVRTVADTRRGAIVNWLHTYANITPMNTWTDDKIEDAWTDARLRLEAQVHQITIKLT